MKKTITLALLLASLYGASQSIEEKKALYEKNKAKAEFYEQQHKQGLAEHNTSPNKTSSPNAFPLDTDNDGMPDAWENLYPAFLNPNDPKDAWGDYDNDQVLNLFEYELGSIPNNASSPTTVDVHLGDSVAAAIDSALPGQLVRVEAGTYHVNYQTFVPKTVMIQGGWNSSFTARDPNNTPTIFDGQDSGAVLYFSYSAGTSNVVVDGINMIDGQAYLGGLTFISQGTAVSNLCLFDCQIINSQSTFSFGGAAQIQHWDNSVSEVFIAKTLIANDSSSAIYNQTSVNTVAKWHVINSTFTNNHSIDFDEGYGIRGFTVNAATIEIDIINSIVLGNQLADLSFDQNGGPADITADYSDIDSLYFVNGVTYNPGAGMINANPQFVNPTSDYHLSIGSPCINTGTDVGLPFAGGAPDMGVYETGLSVIDNISSDNGISITPNPCKSYIDIETNEQNKSLSSLVITNLLGEKLHEIKLSSQSKAIIDVNDLPAGLYFVKLQTEKGSAVQKFIKE